MTDPAVLSVLPGRLDIEFLTGNPVVVELTWLDADGDPVDVSGSGHRPGAHPRRRRGRRWRTGRRHDRRREQRHGRHVVRRVVRRVVHLAPVHHRDRSLRAQRSPLAPYPPGSGPPVGPVSASVVVTTEPATVTVTAAVSSTGGGGSGDVVGPASSSTGRAAEFADATGKLLREAPLTGAGGRPVLDGDGTWAGQPDPRLDRSRRL